MADTKISALPASSGATDAMIFPAVQSADTKRITGAQLTAYFGGIIAANRTITVAPSGGDFTEPGAAFAYLAQFRIAATATVTITIADGTYTCTPIRGHIDGTRISVTTGGLNGAALTEADFAQTGYDAGELAADKITDEATVRAKYLVILEFASGTAFAAGSKHLGKWGAFLAISTGAADGISTGTGASSNIGEGAGGIASFVGACFFGFSEAGGYTDYGGTINVRGCIFTHCNIGLRTDFYGAIYGEDVLVVSHATYGYRANHGGQGYFESFVARCCGNSGIEVTNSPGMAWAHFSDIQGCQWGLTVSYGGTAKAYNSTIKNNTLIQARCTGFIDLRDCDMASTNGSGFGIKTEMGAVDISAVVTGTTVSGHTRDIDVMAGGGVIGLLSPSVATTIYAHGIATTADALGYVRDLYAVGRPDNATLTPAAGVLDLGTNIPKVVNVASSTPGAPDTITSITFTNLAIGDDVTFRALNAPAETINFTDSAGLPLGANRVLDNVRDMLVMRRISVATLAEMAFANNA